MTGRDTATTLGEVLDVLQAAREAGYNVGDSIRILQALITEQPRSEWCQCGHVQEAHNRHRRSKDCALCECSKFQPGY